MCTGTHTVRLQQEPFTSERQIVDLLTHIGAIFSDFQPFPDLGAWHGSERKSFISSIPFRCSGFSMPISYNNHYTTHQTTS